MSPEELKSLRKAAGMSQGELAEALGMNRVTVSSMERGAAPIEKRTALAVEHLIDNKEAFLWRSRKEDEDVPLRDAVILWEEDGSVDPPVKVLRHGPRDDSRYSSTGGRVFADWPAGSDLSRMIKLFRLVQIMTVENGIAPAAVHQALLCIPEYRATLPPTEALGLEIGIEGE